MYYYSLIQNLDFSVIVHLILTIDLLSVGYSMVFWHIALIVFFLLFKYSYAKHFHWYLAVIYINSDTKLSFYSFL